MTIRLCTSTGTTLWRSAKCSVPTKGRPAGCRRKPSGKTPVAAARTRPSVLAMMRTTCTATFSNGAATGTAITHPLRLRIRAGRTPGLFACGVAAPGAAYRASFVVRTATSTLRKTASTATDFVWCCSSLFCRILPLRFAIPHSAPCDSGAIRAIRAAIPKQQGVVAIQVASFNLSLKRWPI